MATVAVILPAAGKSTRFGGKDKKVFANIDGRAVWLRTAEMFVNRPDVVQTLLVVAPEDLELVRTKYLAHMGLLGIEVAEGGPQRFDSVANALARVKVEAELVAIHDAARPCVTASQIDAVFASAAKTGAAILGVPARDTLKRADVSHRIEATVPRSNIWLAQTPQVFRREVILHAYAQRGSLTAEVTDDSQLVEASGFPVHLVAGSASNIKVTEPDDLALAAAILKSRPAPKSPRAAHPFEDEARW
jgi:2-C-methyl-D-erythritol 4-phosphate cytidylyltransferase